MQNTQPPPASLLERSEDAIINSHTRSAVEGEEAAGRRPEVYVLESLMATTTFTKIHAGRCLQKRRHLGENTNWWEPGRVVWSLEVGSEAITKLTGQKPASSSRVSEMVSGTEMPQGWFGAPYPKLLNF